MQQAVERLKEHSIWTLPVYSKLSLTPAYRDPELWLLHKTHFLQRLLPKEKTDSYLLSKIIFFKKTDLIEISKEDQV